MIELSTTSAFLLYLSCTLATLLSIWVFHHYARHKPITLTENRLMTCEYCHTAYLADTGKTVSQCPCCNNFNKR